MSRIAPLSPPSPQAAGTVPRRCPFGAETLPDGRVHARVWAPKRRRVEAVLEPEARVVELAGEGDGWFSGLMDGARRGSLYRFRLDGTDGPFPDPASRFQPDGPHGASEVVDPFRFEWTDHGWQGRTIEDAVIYEMHVGTFTPEGTWAAAMDRLPELADIGVTVVEVMPVADFPGRFGWGYDGVNLYAPCRLYGRPDDMRAFVDRAHALGIAVILDVVYNHFGPDGNYLGQFSDAWISTRYRNEWGDPLNFDGPDSGPVRRFVTANAAYWVDEFHLDGLRLDATQQTHDSSTPHIIAEVTAAARRAARGRAVIVVGENEPQDLGLLAAPEEGGAGLDALWNDDFHHSAMVALTGRNEAYFSDHLGRPQEFISTARHGFLFQGQRYAWQNQRRGTPGLHQSPCCFVTFLQNHDQVANSGHGLRIHQLASAGRVRAMTALLLLGPATPMLFQGQEFAASAPFLYFADHKPDLADAVREGRRAFLRQFPNLAAADMHDRLARPEDEATFRACVLDHGERTRNRQAVALHRDLLRLRREDAALRACVVDGAVLDDEAFLLRFFGGDGDDRLLIVNLGRDIRRPSIPEPLVAPPAGRRWRLLWSSEAPAYGGDGAPEVEDDQGWRIPGHAAVVLAAEPEPRSATALQG